VRSCDGIPEPHLHWIEAKLLGHHLHLNFGSKARVGHAVPPHSRADGIVRENPVGIMFEVGQLVGESAHAPGQVHGQGPDGRMPASISDHPAVHACDGSIPFHTHFVVDDHVVAPPAGHEHLLHAVNELDRLSRHFGE